MSWYFAVLRKYAAFGGRARRKEYWMFALMNAIISIALGFVERALGLGGELSIGILSVVYTLFILLPCIAVGVRRLHDTGRSGWWTLIIFVPLIGALALIYFAVQDSEPGDNAYGPNPKTAFA